MTRQSSGTYRDKHGRQSVRIGTREDNRVFMFNASWSARDVDRVKQQLKDVFDFFGCWNVTSNAVADCLRKGVSPVPIPTPVPEELPERMKIELHLLQGVPGTLRFFPSQMLPRWESELRLGLPTINWASLGESVAQETLEELRTRQMESLQCSADSIASIDNRPPATALPVKGTLHEAIRKYDEYVKADQPTNFDRHAKIKQLIERTTDFPLAILDISQCRILIDYWRNRPERKDKNGNYSAKRSREQLAELDLFFNHTHTSNDFSWRMPEDLQILKRTVRKDDKKNLSYISIKLFTVEELRELIQHGTLIQKLIVVWCLNCSHGAAEIGRVTWGDLYLDQDHPWRSQGLKIEAGGNWTGFLRHKTDVVGWWQLWPETTDLLHQWKSKAERLLNRKVTDSDRLILTQEGLPMYKDTTKNAQSKFAKEFSELVRNAKVTKLPFGTLRNQLSDWISTSEGDAVTASVALAHGVPHKDDKLLFAHYANRPWRKLFEYHMKYRNVVFP